MASIQSARGLFPTEPGDSLTRPLTQACRKCEEKDWESSAANSSVMVSHRDGRIDVVVSHQLGPSVGLNNETVTASGALFLKPVGATSNRNGYGAVVEVVGTSTKVRHELIGGGSFQSASPLEIQIGLGAEKTSTIQIRCHRRLSIRIQT